MLAHAGAVFLGKEPCFESPAPIGSALLLPLGRASSALSRLKLLPARGVFGGYSSLENPLHRPAMRGNLRLN